VVLLLLVAVVVALLPTLVATTPLRNMLVAAAVPGDQVRVTVGEASLGWFSEPVLSRIEIRDAAGEPLAAIESLRVGRTPLALATNWRDLGEVEIARPTVYLAVRPDGSNLEDAIGDALGEIAGSGDPRTTEAAEPTARPLAVAVRVVDGTLLVHDAATGRQWRTSGLNVQYDSRGATSGIGQLNASGQLETKEAGASGAIPAGRFSVSLVAADDGRQQLDWQAEAVSLAVVQPWMHRFVAGTELGGTLSGQATASWTGADVQDAKPQAAGVGFPADFASTGTLRIDQFDATAPALAGDRLRLTRIELPWRLAAQPQGLVIEDLQLRSDVGQLAARGTIDPSLFTSLADSDGASLDAAGRGDVEIRGEIDLAKLAAMLPRALRIRGDTTITSGTIEFAARRRPAAAGGQSLSGMLRTAGLAATSGGRPIRWDQPASATFDLRRENGSTRIESLRCESEFLEVEAAGTTKQLTADAKFDLGRLAAELGQFVDLGGVELAGTGTAHVELSRASGDRSAAVDVRGARLTAADLRVTMGGWRIQEPRVELSGDGRWDSATGEFASQSAELVTSTVAAAARDVRVRTGGNGPPEVSGAVGFRADLARLAAWQTATQDTPPYQPHGMFTGNVRFAQQADRITGELSANGQNLALAQWSGRSEEASRGGGYQTIWQEPQLSIRGTASYEPSADRLTFQQFQVQSNTLEATVGGGIEKLTTAADVNVSGTLNYDLAQLSLLLRPYLGNGVQLVGQEAARFQVAGALAPSSSVEVRSVNLRAGSSSTPAGAADRPARPSPESAFHWSRRIHAQLEAPWSSANVYGLPIGGGKIAASLGDGEVRIEPLGLAVAEGRFTAAPHVRLDPPPSELTLPKGPLVTDVRISPEVSEAMLKYIAPVLAGATKTEGKFSLQLEGARVPLDEPKRADAAGQLTVHSVRVVPGPMAAEWIGLAQQIEAIAKRRDPTALIPGGRQPGLPSAGSPTVTLLSIQDQHVQFRVVDGRVYHQNMEFQIDDLVLRSEGSVGLDETLELVLHVPIPDRWIASDRFLGGLKGQTIDIPVSGTLTRPRMDRTAIAGLTQQLIQGAAQGKVGEEVNRVLDTFLRPR
jgi:hypothetical protein